MNLGWLKGALDAGKTFAVKNAPGILMGMGTVSVGTGVYLAIKNGPKATGLIDDARLEKYEDQGSTGRMPKLSLMEKIRATGKVYIPALGFTAIGLGCFWGAHLINLKRQAILIGLYSSAQGQLEEYQKKLIEIMGEKKHEVIREAIGEDRGKAADISQETPVGLPGAGMTDIWFVIDGKSFPSTYVKVKDAQNEFNHEMMSEMYKSRAELYWKLDPSGTWLKPKGDDFDVGWTIDKLLVLRVDQPFGPVASISYEDKDGLSYIPVAGFCVGR